MNCLSDPVRLTVPITPELSHQLSVLALECDLTRGQLVRRALAHFVTEAQRRHADLLGQSVSQWWASAEARYDEELRAREGVAPVIRPDELDRVRGE